MMTEQGLNNLKVKTMKQSELTSECWLIQMWGINQCKTCEAFNTDECGGQKIREKLLKQQNT